MGDNVKLFVYGVSASCPKSVLEREFDRYGRVSDVFITGKGYAFITMEKQDEAEDAIDALNGKKIDGQDVKVELAHGKGTSKSRDGGGRRDYDRDRRGYGGGGGRFDGGYSRNDRGGDRGGDRGYGRDRE